MDYLKIYNSLIERARNRKLHCYVEKHHIKPLCMGGSNDDDNLVELTPEEHYVAHQLLVKMHPNNESLVYAATMMIAKRPSNKMYGWLARKKSDAAKKRIGELHNSYGTVWVTNGQEDRRVKTDQIPDGWYRGRAFKHSAKTLRMIGKASSSRSHKHSAESKKKMSDAVKASWKRKLLPR